MLVSGLNLASLALQEEKIHVDGMTIPTKGDRDEKIRNIRTGFINRLHLNRPWAYNLGFCEVLNFINVLFQLYLVDWFLGGVFINLGTDIQNNGFADKMEKLFPKVKTCLFCFNQFHFIASNGLNH